MSIELVRFNPSQAQAIWQLGFQAAMPEWAKWNGPYFEDYTAFDCLADFQASDDWHFLLKDHCRCIMVEGKPIGMVSRTWQDQKTLWMEIGIVIYDEAYWCGGYGTQALTKWTSDTFQDFPEIEHLGLTTWSGNQRMMRVAEKMGFFKEAQIRKVRYWQGVYYDSVKYGVLRSEWLNQLPLV